jgi:hypothetical protein
MVMSVCGLKGKIEYVVDSAPFKQGKYTPATHIPIVGPETLVKKPVNAIIIMAGSYSREICGLISKKHKQVRDYVMLENSKLINGKNLK